MQNAERKTQNAERKMQNAECRTQMIVFALSVARLAFSLVFAFSVLSVF